VIFVVAPSMRGMVDLALALRLVPVFVLVMTFEQGNKAHENNSRSECQKQRNPIVAVKLHFG